MMSTLPIGPSSPAGYADQVALCYIHHVQLFMLTSYPQQTCAPLCFQRFLPIRCKLAVQCGKLTSEAPDWDPVPGSLYEKNNLYYMMG